MIIYPKRTFDAMRSTCHVGISDRAMLAVEWMNFIALVEGRMMMKLIMFKETWNYLLELGLWMVDELLRACLSEFSHSL